MIKYIHNYKVMLVKDNSNGLTGYSATVPALGIADEGSTLDDAIENISKMIDFHLTCLREEGISIPPPEHKSDALVSKKLKIDSPARH